MRMKRGDSAETFAIKFDEQPPEIHMVGEGDGAYLWIGGKNGPCYAHLSGTATLRELAQEILKALDS